MYAWTSCAGDLPSTTGSICRKSSENNMLFIQMASHFGEDVVLCRQPLQHSGADTLQFHPKWSSKHFGTLLPDDFQLPHGRSRTPCMEWESWRSGEQVVFNREAGLLLQNAHREWNFWFEAVESLGGLSLRMSCHFAWGIPEKQAGSRWGKVMWKRGRRHFIRNKR